jgi:outer membrane protein assembly factor BamD
MKTRNLFVLLVIFYLATTCGYEKVLKSGDWDFKYIKAMEYYEKGLYVKSATLFEQLKPRLRGTSKAEELNFYHAMSYYRMGDYIMGGHYFRTFVRTFFHSRHAEEADFLAGYCYYLMSPRPNLDQENTYQAINSFTLFKSKFPTSERIEECDRLIAEMEEKLVEKSYLTAKLYFDLGNYKAAMVALRTSLTEYPETKFREELMFLRLKSSFLLAENSIFEKQQERYQSAVDEYYSFIDEFPESE